MQKILFIIGAVLVGISAHAQLGIYNDGHSRMIGARANGMGGAFTAVADDASAAYWNPGALGLLRKNSITTGFWLQQNWASIEKGNYQYFRDATIKENPVKSGFNNFSIAVPIPISNDFRITPVLSYHEYFNYRGLKETWEINYNDPNTGTTSKDTFTYDNTGGVNTISTGFGITLGEHSGMGIVMNTFTGKRTNNYKQVATDGSNYTSNTKSAFSGRSWNFGWKYSTLTFEEQAKRNDNSDLNGFEIGFSATVPQYRKTIVTAGSSKTNYFLNDGAEIRGGIAAIFSGNLFTVDVGHSSYKNTDQSFGTGTNLTSFSYPSDIKITHVSIGIESREYLRAGFMMKNYQTKMIETKKQAWTPSLMAGLSFGGDIFSLDISSQFEIFNWTNTLVYGNGQGIAYKGTGFSLFTTGRFRF